uniref:DRIM domain-containing protein n=1 Tax=Anisakis simplex TaxID=6269 RepID=A0A0M3JK71_ANISI
LFESLKDEQRPSNEILAICIEWIQKGTLIDFNARLDSVRLLANCATVTRRSDRNALKRRLLSVVAYFEQYTKVIALIWFKLISE